MSKQIKKTLVILLAVCFLLSVTAAAASACEEHGYKHKHHKHHKDGYNECKDFTNGEDTTDDSVADDATDDTAADDATSTTNTVIIQQVAVVGITN